MLFMHVQEKLKGQQQTKPQSTSVTAPSLSQTPAIASSNPPDIPLPKSRETIRKEKAAAAAAATAAAGVVPSDKSSAAHERGSEEAAHSGVKIVQSTNISQDLASQGEKAMLEMPNAVPHDDDDDDINGPGDLVEGIDDDLAQYEGIFD